MICDRIDFDSSNYSYLNPQYVLRLKNVYLAANGIVLNEDFEPIWEALQFAGFNPSDKNSNAEKKRHQELIHNIQYYKNNEVIELGDRDYVYCLSRYNIYPYGHIMDHLQPLIKIDKLNLSDPVILKNQSTSHCNEFQKHLKYFGYSDSMIIKFPEWKLHTDGTPNKLYKVKNLWYSSSAAQLARWDSDIIAEVREKYPHFKSLPTKLYLSRGLDVKKRIFTNEAEVRKILQGKGYEILSGGECLEIMITKFTNAESIVFYHGSMVKNILFSEAEPFIREFCSSVRKDYSFKDNAYSKGFKKYEQLMINTDKWFNTALDLSLLDDVP